MKNFPLSFGSILAGALAVPAGILDAYIRAYHVDPPCFKFGREGTFEFGIYFALLDGIMIALSCAIFSCLMSKFYKPFNVVLFVLFLTLSYWFGLLSLDLKKVVMSQMNIGFEIFSLPLTIFIESIFAVFLYLAINEAGKFISEGMRTKSSEA